MRMLRRPWLAAAVPLLLAGGVQAPTPTLDVYVAGIRIAEITPERDGGFSLRTLDRAANTWSPRRTVSAAALGRDRSLPRVARLVVPAIADLDRLPWRSMPAVGWPDAETIYVPDGDLAATVGGREVRATRWVHRDGSRPIDFVVGSRGVLAAADIGPDHVVVRRGFEAMTTVARWNTPDVSPAKYGYRLHQRTMLPMADGVRLATLVYHPTGPVPSRLPTVFIRTPYGITNSIDQYWHHAARGYALVFQAARGTSYSDPDNRSEGDWSPMINEPGDGATAIDWIATQPWSDGGVCMQGGSYVGYTQWTLTLAQHPALKCIIPEVSMGTAFSDQPYWGGTMVEGMAYYVFFMLDKKILPGRTWHEILHHRPIDDIDRFATGEEIPAWNMLLAHQTNDTLWQRQDWYRSTAPRQFSAFQISGWFDDDFPGTESNWNLMQRLGQGPQRLLIGPWKHGYNADRRLNGYSFGPAALRDDVWLLKQQWYDYHLKGRRNGVDDVRVEYFVLGSNVWRTATAWPPPEAEAQSWYLGGDGQAARLTTRGTLSRSKAGTTEPPDRYDYDPANPPQNWYSFDQMQRWQDVQTFPYDFKDIEARPDVAVYTSPPLDRDLTIAGDVHVVLYASTDVLDTDWWVHLADVDTTGRSNRLTLGVRRARFRHNDDPVHNIIGSNYESPQLLSGDPADVVRYEFSLRSIANTFRKGHRIRVAIANAMDNYSFPNSNTGGDEGQATTTKVARIAIHHSAIHASHVRLPVIR